MYFSNKRHKMMGAIVRAITNKKYMEEHFGVHILYTLVRMHVYV